MKNWQWTKQVFLLSPLFKEGEGGNLFEIMALGGGTYSGEGAFSGIHSIHFFKNFITCHLSLSTNKYHDCKLL